MGCHTNSFTEVEILCGRGSVLEMLSWRCMRDASEDVRWPAEDIIQGAEPEGWKGTQYTSVLIILPVDEAAGAKSHRQSTGPGEAGIYFHLWRRARHLLCWRPASQLFTFIRLIPKYCLPPLISLSIHCSKKFPRWHRPTTPQMLNCSN